jgi:hypothetical protein
MRGATGAFGTMRALPGETREQFRQREYVAARRASRYSPSRPHGAQPIRTVTYGGSGSRQCSRAARGVGDEKTVDRKSGTIRQLFHASGERLPMLPVSGNIRMHVRKILKRAREVACQRARRKFSK